MSRLRHPVFGIARPEGETPVLCSRCRGEILDDDAKATVSVDAELTLPSAGSDTRSIAQIHWIFCEGCTAPVARYLCGLFAPAPGARP